MFYFLIFVFGGLGALSRYGLSKISLTTLPLGTLVANVVGSLLIALLYVYSSRLEPHIGAQGVRVLSVGFLGALTTFSTFSLETVKLFQQGDVFQSLTNIFLNLLLSLFVCATVLFWAKNLNT